MGITPLTFTGISSYSDDFQTILSRAVSIASLPIQHLQSDQADLLSRKAAMGDLRTAAASMKDSLSRLTTLAQTRSLAISSSSSKVIASLPGAAGAGTYVVSEIRSLASSALSTTKAGFNDIDHAAVTGPDNTLQLIVGGVETEVALTNETNSLAGLRDKINSLGAGVTASIIDTGAATNRYFLSISANSSGENEISLRSTSGDPETNILSTNNSGSNATFKINGQPVTRTSNSISGLIPGVQLDLAGLTEGEETISISVATDRAPISSALQSFVNAYNGLAEQTNTQVGESAGALAGDSMIREIFTRMRGMTAVSGTGAIQSLYDLGITLDSDGIMSIDTSIVEGLDSAKVNSVFDFLGTASSGLGAFAGQFDALSNDSTGLMVRQIDSYDESDSRISGQIDQISQRVNDMQASLAAKLQAADALLAQLASQQSMLTATIDSLNVVSYGKKS